MPRRQTVAPFVYRDVGGIALGIADGSTGDHGDVEIGESADPKALHRQPQNAEGAFGENDRLRILVRFLLDVGDKACCRSTTSAKQSGMGKDLGREPYHADHRSKSVPIRL